MQRILLVAVIFAVALVVSGQLAERIQVAPRAPSPPQIKDYSVSVADYGARANDDTDDTQAIQAAMDEVADSGGGSIMFEPGTYTVSIDRSRPQTASTPYAITLRSGIRLAATEPGKTTIKLAGDQGKYKAIFAEEAATAPIENFAMYGLTVDSNGSENPVESVDDLGLVAGSERFEFPRIVVRVFSGSNISIDRCAFINHQSVNVLSFNSDASNVHDVEITDSRFERVGGARVDYDHSSIYTHGARMRIADNYFASSFGPGTMGARTAIETHGDDQTVTGNEITGYVYGMNITGVAASSARQLVRENEITESYAGILLWSYFAYGNTSRPGLEDIELSRNTITLDVNGWRESGIIPEESPTVGIALELNSDAPVNGLNITDNEIKFSNFGEASFQAATSSSGVALQRYAHPDVPVGNLSVHGNRIEDSPGPGIQGNTRISGTPASAIDCNVIVNPGRSPSWDYPPDEPRSGVYMTHPMTDLSVSGNYTGEPGDTGLTDSGLPGRCTGP